MKKETFSKWDKEIKDNLDKEYSKTTTQIKKGIKALESEKSQVVKMCENAYGKDDSICRQSDRRYDDKINFKKGVLSGRAEFIIKYDGDPLGDKQRELNV
jgi:hypothetical protein